MNKSKCIEELRFCLDLWESNGGCSFGGKTKCEDCAVPYLLLKFINGEVLHGDMQRLSLADWKNKMNDFNEELK